MLSGQSITDVIISRLMESGKLIKSERDKRGWSQADLGRRVGMSQPAIKKVEDGKTVKSKYLPKIAEVLDIPLAKLDSSLSQYGYAPINPAMELDVAKATQSLKLLAAEDVMGAVDLPVFSTVQGGQGALVLSNEPFRYVARPHILTGIQGGYGVLVKGDSMAREYNENDIAYVNPHLHPKKGDPCVFQNREDDGTMTAIIKYLERSPAASESVYFVSQTNPIKKFTIRKADWQFCHVAVGKVSGRE
jgi:phage repressor protein C with HTH and peptisase S24 domain